MLSKNAFLEKHDGSSPSKRLKNNVSDLFLSGQVSAKRARLLVHDAIESDPAELKALAVKEGHVKRDLLRKMKKDKKWPGLFECSIPCWDQKKCKVESRKLSFLLPHEVLGQICQFNFHASDLFNMDALRTECRDYLKATVKELQLPMNATLPVSLWLDGVPVKFDRSESLECVTWSMPHMKEQLQSMRFPICCMYKSHMDTSTWDAIFKVVAWSLTCCAEGVYPSTGPDGEPLQGQFRKKLAGKPLAGDYYGSVHAALVEVRGDWAAYKSTFKLPGWADSKEGCCYRCMAKHEGIRDCSLHAPWRKTHMTHWEVVARILKNGPLPPIFSCPGFRAGMFCIDWLHACDQGVGQDFLGNAMWLIMQNFHDCSNEKAKLSKLFQHIQQYYKRTACENCLDALTSGMVRKDAKKSPKLRSKAGECRHLIPWAVEATQEFLDPADPESSACIAAAQHLLDCYNCLSERVFNKDKLGTSCRKFLLIYASLEALAGPSRWRFKPKMHMWQHLCEESESSPSKHWTYRDEDFGGSLARMSTRRGGHNNPSCLSANVLHQFIAQHDLPELT